VEVYINKQKYDKKEHEFLVEPKTSIIYELSVDDIEEFYIVYFSHLNQYPIYITFEWYDDDFDGMEKILDKAGVSNNHQFIPQGRAFRLTEQGDLYFDILFFTVEVHSKEQLSEVVEETLIPYHQFFISTQKNIAFGEQFYKEDSIQIAMDETDTTTVIKFYDVPGTYLLSSQFTNLNEIIGSFPKCMKVIADEEDD
jgi:hypothetical protein